MCHSGQGLDDLAFYASDLEKHFYEGNEMSSAQRKSLIQSWDQPLRLCKRLDAHGLIREWSGSPPFRAILPDKAEERQRAPRWLWRFMTRPRDPSREGIPSWRAWGPLWVPGEEVFGACQVSRTLSRSSWGFGLSSPHQPGGGCGPAQHHGQVLRAPGEAPGYGGLEAPLARPRGPTTEGRVSLGAGQTLRPTDLGHEASRHRAGLACQGGAPSPSNQAEPWRTSRSVCCSARRTCRPS